MPQGQQGRGSHCSTGEGAEVGPKVTQDESTSPTSSAAAPLAPAHMSVDSARGPALGWQPLVSGKAERDGRSQQGTALRLLGACVGRGPAALGGSFC